MFAFILVIYIQNEKFFFLRERQSVDEHINAQGGGEEGEIEREILKQAPHSAQSPMWGLIA